MYASGISRWSGLRKIVVEAVKPLNVHLLKSQAVSLFAPKGSYFLLGALVEVFRSPGLMFHKSVENTRHAVVVNANFVGVFPVHEHIAQLICWDCGQVIQ